MMDWDSLPLSGQPIQKTLPGLLNRQLAAFPPEHCYMEVSWGFIDSQTVYSLFPIAEMHRERLLESQCRSIKAKVWATLPSISFFFLISTLETFPNLKSQIKFSYKGEYFSESHLENFFSKSSSVTSLNRFPTNNRLLPSLAMIVI